MFRRKNRRSLGLECLESRELLSQGGPSAEQEYMLYLLNQARQNPVQTAQRVTTNLDADVQATVQYYNVDLNQVRNAIASAAPQPPLAWNGELANAAQGHSQDMASNDFQSHTGSDGSSSSQRMTDAGYTNATSSGEDAFAYATSIDEAMEAYLIDWGVASDGHRDNILQPNTAPQNAYRDVGIGLVSTSGTNIGPLVVTDDFGAQSNEQAQLVGVVYNDPSHTQFFAPGEGQGGVTITATNLKTGQSSSVQTWDSGGYQMPLSPGQYQVTATYNGEVVGGEFVTIGKVNVEVDFDLTDPLPGTTPPPATQTPAVAVAPNNTSNNNSSNNSSNSTPNSNNSNSGSITNSNMNFSSNNSPTVAIAPNVTPTTGTPQTQPGWSSTWSSWLANQS